MANKILTFLKFHQPHMDLAEIAFRILRAVDDEGDAVLVTLDAEVWGIRETKLILAERSVGEEEPVIVTAGTLSLNRLWDVPPPEWLARIHEEFPNGATELQTYDLSSNRYERWRFEGGEEKLIAAGLAFEEAAVNLPAAEACR